MNKKLLCGVLSTAVLFGACPTVAFAGDYHNLTKSLDFRNAKEDITDKEIGYEWDASSQTLTLEDFRISVAKGQLEEEAAIYLPDESTIEVEGDNNSIEVLSYRCDAIYCEGELWVEGDGELEIITDSLGASAFYLEGGPIVFDDEVEVNIDPAGYIIYVEKAKGSKPIIDIRDEAKVIFPDDCTDRNIMVTHKSSVTPTSNWLNYSEEHDEWDETINLVQKKVTKTETKKEETTSENTTEQETPAVQSEYKITIGNAAIKKDGYVTFISDAKPYLSNGYTMLPLRALLNVTGADVDITWDAATKTVTVRKNSDSQYTKMVYIVIGEDQIIHGNETIAVSTPAELKDGRAFVSLRDWMNILSALDMPASDLSWDAKTKTVTFMQ